MRQSNFGMKKDHESWSHKQSEDGDGGKVFSLHFLIDATPSISSSLSHPQKAFGDVATILALAITRTQILTANFLLLSSSHEEIKISITLPCRRVMGRMLSRQVIVCCRHTRRFSCANLIFIGNSICWTNSGGICASSGSVHASMGHRAASLVNWAIMSSTRSHFSVAVRRFAYQRRPEMKKSTIFCRKRHNDSQRDFFERLNSGPELRASRLEQSINSASKLRQTLVCRLNSVSEQVGKVEKWTGEVIESGDAVQ